MKKQVSDNAENLDKKEKEMLADEVRRLSLENKKLSLELKIANTVLEKLDLTAGSEAYSENLLFSENAVNYIHKDILLEFCPDVLFLLDKDGKFVFCSRALIGETGIEDFRRIENRLYKEILPDILDNESCGRLMEAILEAENSEGEESVILSEYFDFGNKGFPRYCTVELTPINGISQKIAGIAPGILVVFKDLTELMTEKKRVEIAGRVKSDFLSTMSHEIRTPMNAILGMAEIMSRTSLDIQQKKYIDNIKRSSNALLSIITNILDFSRIEAGNVDIEKNYYNPHELFDGLYSMFAAVFKNKNLEFYFSASKHIPDKVYGDANRLKQVLSNILSNALKYTPEGHVEFFAWMSDDGMLHVGIHDTGIGIRPDDLKRLFLPFEQIDLRKNKYIAGTGLGLAISRRLCELMGGQLSVESAYGAGTTFTIDIPCMTRAEAPTNESEEKIAEFSANGANVLVVDDIEINLSVAEAMLQIFDINPDMALRGAEAVDMASEKQYDLIFMDHMMPEMDGFETMKQIRMIGRNYENIPIVALTANVINNAEQMFLENGFNGFIPKPIEINTLNLCLRKFLPANLIKSLTPDE